jgi:hypothetical protein
MKTSTTENAAKDPGKDENTAPVVNQLVDPAKRESEKGDIAAHFPPTGELSDINKAKPKKLMAAKPLGAPSDLVQNKAARSKAKRVFAKAKVTDPTEKSIDRYIERMLAQKLNPLTQSCRLLCKEIGKI